MREKEKQTMTPRSLAACEGNVEADDEGLKGQGRKLVSSYDVNGEQPFGVRE